MLKNAKNTFFGNIWALKKVQMKRKALVNRFAGLFDICSLIGWPLIIKYHDT